MACPESGKPVLFDFFVEMPSGKVKSALDFFPVDIDFGGARQEFQIGKVKEHPLARPRERH